MFNAVCVCVFSFCLIYEYGKCARISLWQFSLKRYSISTDCLLVSALPQIISQRPTCRKVPHDRIFFEVRTLFLYSPFPTPFETHVSCVHESDQRACSNCNRQREALGRGAQGWIDTLKKHEEQINHLLRNQVESQEQFEQ